tara:strand:- start:1486 stop:2010 length:525 start_codon:yes stop_codon:yes gene_type:complete
MYFDMIPKIYYDSKANDKYDLLTNLMTRVKLRTDIKNDIFDYDYYDVVDGESPEMIAFKYYDNPEYHWTILVANDIIDYYRDWPMSNQRFEEYVKEKYTNIQDVHHYEITQSSGDTTKTINVGLNNTDYESASAISNYTYEQRLQDEKRQIRLISPRFITQFVEEFREKIDEGI